MLQSSFMRYIIPIIFLILVFLHPISTFAHPLDELGDVKVYDEKQILTIDKESTELKIEIKFFAYEKTVVWETLDNNKDREISEDEKNNWMQLGKKSSWIVFNNRQYFFEPEEIVLSDYFDFFSPPPTTITLLYRSDITLPSKGSLEYFYRGRDKKLNEIQLEVKGTNKFAPSSINKIPPDQVQIKFGQSNSKNTQLVQVKSSDKLRNFLDKYIKTTGEIPLSLKLWAIVIAFSIGALHALTPGHGKAISAGFLIGERGTILHALHLGLIITVTHTASVFLLGLGALLLTQYIVPDTVIRWLNFLSGLLIFVFGLYLVYIRANKIIHGHSHQIHIHKHQHTDLSLKSLLPLGISGGIVPCVDALAILIVAVSLNKILFGIILLLSFSLGLASILIAGGVLVVVAKNKAAKKFQHLSHLEPYLSLSSAVIVTILGILLLIAI